MVVTMKNTDFWLQCHIFQRQACVSEEQITFIFQARNQEHLSFPAASAGFLLGLFF
jgi:hypothetical protein